MQIYRYFSVLSGILLSATPASVAIASDTQIYAELGAASSEAVNLEESTHISGIVRAGLELKSWAALEVEGILGLGKGSESQFDGDELEGGLDHQFGGYLRLGYPVEDRYMPYFRVGVASAQTSVTRTRTRNGETTNRKKEDRFTGASVGLGFQGLFGESRQNGVRLDLTVMFADGDEEVPFDVIDGTGNISLTYVRRF